MVVSAARPLSKTPVGIIDLDHDEIQDKLLHFPIVSEAACLCAFIVDESATILIPTFG